MILVGASANRLDIGCAVCVGPIYAAKLLSLDLTLGFHASNQILQLARVFKVLSTTLSELMTYYTRIFTSVSPHPVAYLFPKPTAVAALSIPQLEYKHPMSNTGQPALDIADFGAASTALYTAVLVENGETTELRSS